MTKNDWTGLFLLVAALAGLYGPHMANVDGWPGAVLTGISGLILGYHVGKQKS